MKLLKHAILPSLYSVSGCHYYLLRKKITVVLTE